MQRLDWISMMLSFSCLWSGCVGLNSFSLCSLIASFDKIIEYISRSVDLNLQISMLAKTIETLASHEIKNLATVKLEEVNMFFKRAEGEDITIRKNSSIEVALDKSVDPAKVDLIQEALSSEEVDVEVTQSLAVGDAFTDYGEISNVFDDGKTVLKHNEGEVLLVDVWATWCGPCQGPMQHNQDMLTKNKAAWEGKARIVAVSVDDDKENIKKRVETKKWSDIIHLTLGGWDGEHRLVKDFSIQGIPFVCLVNKFGKIDYIGHPSGVKLEDRINELIAQDAAPANAGAAAASSWDDKHTEEISKILSADNIKQIFAGNDALLVLLRLSSTYNKGNTDVKVVLKVGVFDSQTAGLNTLKEQIQSAGLNTNIKIEEDYIKTVPVPKVENPTCWECSQHLTYPYYWLKWEEGAKFGCRKCVEAPSAIPHHHFKYEKNSVFLTGETKEIAVKGLGKNLQPESPEKVTSKHPFMCNGCGSGSKSIGEARYICLGCRNDPNPRGDYVDLCWDCFEKLNANNEGVLELLKSDNHKESHPLLRILYNVKGYYEF